MRAGSRVVLLLLIMAVGLAVAGLLGPATSAAAAPGDPTADRVVIVGVPGLVWGDIDPEGTPQLWDLAGDSAIGALSVRAARATTCLLDGWATLGAGNRARYPGPDEPILPVPIPTVPLPEGPVGATTPDPGSAEDGTPSGDGGTGDSDSGTDGGGAGDFGTEGGAPPPQVDSSLSFCGLQEQVADVGLADPLATVERIREDEGTARFGAEPGALGAAVGCAGVVGRAAAVAVAAPGTRLTVTDALPEDPGELAMLMGGCPLTVLSLDQLTEAGEPGVASTVTGTDPVVRGAALTELDRSIGRVRDTVAGLPGEILLLLQGISEVNDGRPRLHVAMATGPGVDRPGWLSSASTGRAPFVQLIDTAPTALRALGIGVPAVMSGQPVGVAGDRPALTAAVAELARIDVRAVTHYRNTGSFFWFLVAVNALVVGGGVAVLGGVGQPRWWPAFTRRVLGRRERVGQPASQRVGRPSGRSWGRALRPFSLAVAALPAATYLANLIPWERAGSPRLALAATVPAVAVLLVVGGALVGARGPWRRSRLSAGRRSRLAAPAAILALTLATLLADVLTGSRLELDGLLGYDAIVAGRFTGYGNLTSGLLFASGLLITAGLAASAGRRVRPARARLVTAGVALAAGLVVVGVVGAPALGRDFGGVLAGVPGFLVLAMLLTGTRVTVSRLIAVLGASVVVVGAVAVLDWLRPVGERTHLGRFVAQVLDGQAWTVIARKAEANLNILLGSPLAWMLVVALVGALWLLHPGGLLRSGPGRRPGGLAVGDVQVLRAGLIASGLSLGVGAVVNDSGVALPATAAALLLPLAVWLAAAARHGIPADATLSGEGTGEGTAGAQQGEGTDRVSVSSRGSTVGNT